MTDRHEVAASHFGRLARLLALESRAEAERAVERSRRRSGKEAERTGNSLVDLVVADDDTGLGGRYLVKLVKRTRGPLPWTRLDVGSPVLLSGEGDAPPSGTGRGGTSAGKGVISQRTEHGIEIAMPGVPNSLAEFETWRIDLADDEIATARALAAMRAATAARATRLAELRDCLLTQREPEFSTPRDDPPLNDRLNKSQRDAVRFALSARDLALIHGPPGTGKTTAVVELIRRAVQRGEKVLACAPSNLAVDNIFERLLAAGERAVRLGHPARVLPGLREHTLDLLVDQHPDIRLARKLVKEALTLFKKAGRYTRAKPLSGARRETRDQAKALLADARRLEDQALNHLLDTADILCATTTGLDAELLGDRRFHLAVIDEACQSTEPGAWIPILRADRVVLAGDHCQLPPTILSGEAAAGGLGESLFERLMRTRGTEISRRLDVQYRMHEAIMEFSSREFYQGDLKADASVASHLLSELAGVTPSPLTSTPIEFVDTAGAGYDEELEPDGESRLNPREADVVVRRVRSLLEAGVPPADIAVIAPYSAQVRHLRERLDVPGVEVDSVDGFQGREKEAVIISLVRSNRECEIGFLQDVRRINVALTRARCKLIVIGDSATLGGHPFYGRLLAHFESLGAYRTVWDEVD